MHVELVLTAIAEDRPGVVETLAAVIAGQSGNWIDSEMARLGGAFAGILRVAVPEERAASLERALADLRQTGITVSVHRLATAPARTGRPVRLELTGQDHPGIVLEATRVLAAQAVNVETLHTQVFPGSMSGEAMFSAQADIVLPEGLSVDALREALETIADDLMVDFVLEDAESD